MEVLLFFCNSIFFSRIIVLLFYSLFSVVCFSYIYFITFVSLIIIIFSLLFISVLLSCLVSSLVWICLFLPCPALYPEFLATDLHCLAAGLVQQSNSQVSSLWFCKFLPGSKTSNTCEIYIKVRVPGVHAPGTETGMFVKIFRTWRRGCLGQFHLK